MPDPLFQENRTAMLLTGQEWDDLEEICRYYQGSAGGTSGWNEEDLKRQNELCKRIIESNS